MLSINNLTKLYKGSEKGIRNLTLDLVEGDICAFIGMNGAGKTTSIKSIVGIHGFDQGDIELDGVSIEKNPQEFKQMVGYSPDTPVLYGNMTGYSYLELIGSIYQIDNETINEQLNTLLKKLNFGSAFHELISTYSHGMKQRLVLISILMHNPKLIVLDEPFVGLDPNATYFLQEEMKKRAAEGSIVLYSTHVLEVAEKLCNKVVMIHNGEVVVNDTMINLLSESSLGEKFRSITAHE
ncbi:ABC transporter ATP-binding protein [Planococcus ruber]|uniref:ABC transporter ATP-binding protein n=1 Tax=Planococcus ruber TaxID=2027871 RepID=UPI001FED62D2|nr:ABC transporter ATP-binding protein [Planococcus ruber]MCJ1907530.1 ABC transporter ATP-binding protein [Planococcus ruber]